MKLIALEHGDGPLGSWTEYQRPQALTREQESMLCLFVVHAPGAHPAWHHYLLSAVHLRPIEGVEPPVLQFPAATHEVMVLALEPKHPADEWPAHYLTPPNVVAQVACTDDDVVRDVVRKAAEAVTTGVLPVEDGGERLSDYWKGALTNTIEHVVTGGHG